VAIAHTDTNQAAPPEVPTVEEALKQARTNQDITLWDLSHQSAVLVVFLRHFGCTYCRATVSELVAVQRPLQQNGIRLAFVHQGTLEEGDEFFAGYDMMDFHHVSDPQRELYQAFKLRRGSLWQVLGLRPVWRALREGLIAKFGVGRIQGDEFQMPGVFLIHEGKIEQEFRHRYVSDKPDYLALAECDICTPEPSTAAE